MAIPLIRAGEDIQLPRYGLPDGLSNRQTGGQSDLFYAMKSSNRSTWAMFDGPQASRDFRQSTAKICKICSQWLEPVERT
jgi:hypothetical protein